MNKKIIIPALLVLAVVIIIVATCSGGGNKIKVEWQKVEASKPASDSVDLKVYVENSGSMDAYMCKGSNLKDAVFDYISDLKKYSTTCSLYYINSKVIPYSGNVQSYIKDLTSESFAKAGGDRSNTDLRDIFANVMAGQGKNTVSVFVSDCILDIKDGATDFFGNCQVSIKNTFNEALEKNPNLGVIIMRLESKFDGNWYCGANKEMLTDAKRPYFIWVIGDKQLLAKFNKQVPVDDIIGGISNYCAYSSPSKIPFDMEKDTYVTNGTKKISIEVLVNLNESLQSDMLIKNPAQYKSSNSNQTVVANVEKITDENSPYSHVITLEISSPETVHKESLTFSYPSIASWVEEFNDETGVYSDKVKDKTTGILALVKGVADAYKSSTNFGSVTFNLKNK